MAVRVVLDQQKCQGHARCAILAPEVFDVDDLGKGYVLTEEITDHLVADAREAALTCPEGAITVLE